MCTCSAALLFALGAVISCSDAVVLCRAVLPVALQRMYTICSRCDVQLISLLFAGPGPALDLDGGNVVFGQVIEGFDVLQQMAAVLTIKPNDTVVGYNQLAQFFGDDRAAKARDKWDKPLQALVITDAGVL